jgi:hypothetical protein
MAHSTHQINPFTKKHYQHDVGGVPIPRYLTKEVFTFTFCYSHLSKMPSNDKRGPYKVYTSIGYGLEKENVKDFVL